MTKPPTVFINVGLGLVAGVVIGLFIDNIAIGIGIGIVVAIAMSLGQKDPDAK